MKKLGIALSILVCAFLAAVVVGLGLWATANVLLGRVI